MICVLNKLIILTICLFTALACGSIEELDRVAKVNEVQIELSPRGKVINRGRNLVLEGKQSLKIALLKIKFLGSASKHTKDSVVVLDRDIFFDKAEQGALTVTDEQRLSLLQSLLPELFQIYSALDEIGMKLIVYCTTDAFCTKKELVKWMPQNIRAEGVGPSNRARLSLFKPLLILSNNKNILKSLERYQGHSVNTYWTSRWIKLPEFSKVNLSYSEWNSLVPTITSF